MRKKEKSQFFSSSLNLYVQCKYSTGPVHTCVSVCMYIKHLNQNCSLKKTDEFFFCFQSS